jgi:UDP-N-acetylglucosamine 1-carboxyvinyltransferase
VTIVDDKLRNLQAQAHSKLRVEGPTTLTGTVRVQGAKNTALKVIPGLAGFPRKYILENTPIIIDTLELFSILEQLGATVEFAETPGTVIVDTNPLKNMAIPFEVTKRTTTAFYLAGALLGRFGSVEIGKPGGDEIGARPVDLHLDAFRALGATVKEGDTTVGASLDGPQADARVQFRMPSAGAAVNAALAAASAGGQVAITTYPSDSDMQGFFEFLRRCGCRVEENDGQLIVDGSSSTSPATTEVNFQCPPDRNDTMTWLHAAAFSTEGVEVSGLDRADVEPGIEVLNSLGLQIESRGATTVFARSSVQTTVVPEGYTVIAGASPGFHSDWAPMLQLVLSSAQGSGTTIDTLHSNRVRQAELLKAMGVDVGISGGNPPENVVLHFRTPLDKARYRVSVRGKTRLKAIDAAVGNDVRACATAVLAATQADGVSQLTDIYALFRGYEDYIGRLRQLGAKISFD